MSTRELAKIGGIGILLEEDLPELTGQRLKVFTLMKDQQWHRAPDILAAAGGSEGLRRMRELREYPGIEIERRRNKASRCFEYRLVPRRN